MTTKLKNVAPWKWKNDNIKERCERKKGKGKKGKGFSHFPFSVQNKQRKWKMSFPLAIFLPLP